MMVKIVNNEIPYKNLLRKIESEISFATGRKCKFTKRCGYINDYVIWLKKSLWNSEAIISHYGQVSPMGKDERGNGLYVAHFDVRPEYFDIILPMIEKFEIETSVSVSIEIREKP